MSKRILDKRIKIWNILHDGEITAISEDNYGKLIIFVNIPYLRRRMKPIGDSFVLTLEGLTRLEFHDFDGTLRPLREEIDMGSPEILSTDSKSMPIKIFTTTGELILDFQSIHIALDTGQEIEFETIERVCEEYWDEWEAKTKNKQ